MRSILSINEIVDSFELDGCPKEVCAEAEATYQGSRLKVKLDCFLRDVGITVKEHHRHPDWLPRSQVQTEVVAREEASELAREIFSSWVKRLRSAIAENKTMRKETK